MNTARDRLTCALSSTPPTLEGQLRHQGTLHADLVTQRRRMSEVGYLMAGVEIELAKAAGLMSEADEWGPNRREAAIASGEADPSYRVEPPASGYRIPEETPRAA